MHQVLRDLKLGTEALHRDAERHVRILDDSATEATYIRYLRRMLGFHGPIEERFAEHAALGVLGFDAPARRKQDLIRTDLARLDALGAELACPALPDTTSVPGALGVAYVLEGSTLGGPFILSRMRERFGYLIGVATNFLEGYGAETGAMWRRFCAIAADALVGHESRVRAVRAAQETFEALIEWLDEPAADPPHPYRGLVRRPATVES